MEIREICREDAEMYLTLLQQLDHETTFMLHEPEEQQITIEEQRERLERIEQAEHQTIFIARDNKELVGFIAGFGGTFRRNRFCASVVVGVLQDYTRQGLGTQLFETLEIWASERNIRRLELTVMEHNRPAMLLYAKLGFHIEGLLKQTLFVDGEFVDEFPMAKLLDNSHPEGEEVSRLHE